MASRSRHPATPTCFTQLRFLASLLVVLGSASTLGAQSADVSRPNIILVMADDQGWGQTGYYNHPVLKTPHLDAMSESGMRFDRFYAGAPVCSPTRASVLTGRTPMRTGVPQHGHALRHQEQSIAQILRSVGYQTTHFGKWHLNGLRGPGVPILADDTHHPGHFGFDRWLSVTNFFDRNPLMSRQGEFESFQGDSSEVIVDQAIRFIQSRPQDAPPFFSVIWFGSPHSPFVASDTDRGSFAELKAASQHHHGELVAMDRSIGNLRSALRRQGIAENTLVWFCSDNGGLPEIQPDTTGGLRGNKGKIYEGGLRVPCLVEWPAGIANPQVVTTPACTMDIFPTIVEIVQAEQKVVSMPRDGISLRGWFDKPATTRESPIGFCFQDNWAMVDDNYKILALRTPQNRKAQESSDGYRIEVYDLINDPNETTNLRTREPKRTAELQATLSSWQQSVRKSVAGKDYPEGRVQPADRQPQHWADTKVYEPYFQQWKQRPEYGDWLRRRGK